MVEWVTRHTIKKKSSYSREKINIQERTQRCLDDMELFWKSKKFNVTKPTWDELKASKITYPFHRAKIVSGTGENLFMFVKNQLVSNTGYTRNNEIMRSWNFFITKEKYESLKAPFTERKLR